jgi:YfiH family protein
MFDMNSIILPAATAPYEWTTTEAGPALVCRALEPYARHVFTTRAWTLGRSGASDTPDGGWHEVATLLAVEMADLVRVRQPHGTGVAVAERDVSTPRDADIVISRDPTRAVAVRVADCVPVLLVDRRSGAVAAVHAGWRGLALRAPAAAVAALEREYHSSPSDLLAAAGPSIGACCYEVGTLVRDVFSHQGFDSHAMDRWFLTKPSADAHNPTITGVVAGRVDHWFFDGWAATRDQLVAAGVPRSQIFSAGICTASHPEAFCSYRRDGAGAGRLAGAIRANPPRS